MAKAVNKKKVQFLGTGRRKKAIARVRLLPGNGSVVVNKRSLDEYFGLDTLKQIVNQPLVLVGATDKYDVYVNALTAAVLPVRQAQSVTVLQELFVKQTHRTEAHLKRQDSLPEIRE